MTKNLRPYQQKALDLLKKYNKGQLIIPTGGGKTLIFMEDVKDRILSSDSNLTIVIVAPKILLSAQLYQEFQEHLQGIKNIHFTQVHSGEEGTTNIELISSSQKMANVLNYHHLLFTTYKSLPRINEANIHIDVAIFDEAHHSVLESNFVGVAQTSQISKNSFFFTATIRHTNSKTTMSNSDVYGGTIISLTPKELVEGGFILPPKVKIKKFDVLSKDEISAEVDCKNIISTIDEDNVNKILICSKSTNQIIDLMIDTNFIEELKLRNYSYMYITSKTGAIIDGIKVSREKFFNTLDMWGKITNKKFVVIHRSILSEGISISGLEAAVFLRNMDIIEMTQNIGRVLRKDGRNKEFGLCVVPVYSNVGIATVKRLETLIHTMFDNTAIYSK